MKYTDKQIDETIEGVFSGKLSTDNLPEDLYLAISDNLKSGLYKGFGGDLGKLEGKDFELLKELRENIYMFSGAKTYQQVREMSDLLQGPDGLRSLSEFKEAALEIYKTYNETWLETEYKTAVGQGASAVAWQQIQEVKDVLPFLKYDAIQDERTSEICSGLNGLIAPVDSPLWDKYAPLNHFNCRCVLLQLEEDPGTGPDHAAVLEKIDPLIRDEFKSNPGKTGYVFSPDHAYFNVLKEDKEAAQNNFNLPIPEPTKEEDGFTFGAAADLMFKKWGVDIDKKLYNLLNKDLTVIPAKKSFAYGSKSEIHIEYNSRRWKKSEEFRERVIYHEIGHVIHDQKGIVNFMKQVSPEYKKHFSELKKLVENPAEINKKIIQKYNSTFSTDKEVLSDLLDKYNASNIDGLRELIGATADSLMSLTSGVYGWGHTKTYMKKLGAKEAEIFAHSIENRFKGNLFFKEFLPEVYDETIKFIKSIE